MSDSDTDSKLQEGEPECGNDARTIEQFVSDCTEEMYREFRTIFEVEPLVKSVHAPTKSNSFLSIFHHYFVQKHVANIKSRDANCRIIDKYISIFPFPVSDEIALDDTRIDKILDYMDNDLCIEMEQFLNEHFDADSVNFRSHAKKFFANIINCQQKNVPEVTIVTALQAMKLIGLPVPCKNNPRISDVIKRCEYLNSYPRLNEKGINRYVRLHEVIIHLHELYDKTCNISPAKYQRDYLRKLPEINFYELYSLLKLEFLRKKRAEYVYRFKKYLFFFVNALHSDSKPVHFIDDGLFECVQYYSIFRKSRQDVELLKFELSMMSVVRHRKQPFFVHGLTYRLDDENLQRTKNYISNFEGIENASILNEIRSDILENIAFLIVDETYLEVCFQINADRTMKSFFYMLLKAAMMPDIKRLVRYSGITGEESSIPMPSEEQIIEIIEFMSKYDVCDFSQTLPAEKFIFEVQKSFYEGNVAKWEPNSKFLR